VGEGLRSVEVKPSPNQERVLYPARRSPFIEPGLSGSGLYTAAIRLYQGGARVMDDDMQRHLDSMTEQEREEIRTFLARFDEQVERKREQLLNELQDPGSEEAVQMRAELLEGRVPLLDENENLIFKPRSELRLEDVRRFAAFLDADAERRLRDVAG
jgi:hypothetical protein